MGISPNGGTITRLSLFGQTRFRRFLGIQRTFWLQVRLRATTEPIRLDRATDFAFTLIAFIVGPLTFFLFTLKLGVGIAIFSDEIFLSKGE